MDRLNEEKRRTRLPSRWHRVSAKALREWRNLKWRLNPNHSSVKHRLPIIALRDSHEVRLTYLREQLAIGPHAGESLNRALARIVMCYGTVEIAELARLSPTSLYRTFSAVDRRDIRVETVDRVLRALGMRLDIVELMPDEAPRHHLGDDH